MTKRVKKYLLKKCQNRTKNNYWKKLTKEPTSKKQLKIEYNYKILFSFFREKKKRVLRGKKGLLVKERTVLLNFTKAFSDIGNFFIL